MQKHEGNLEDGEVQQRGFTERSLNILLKKIVDVENKEKGEDEPLKEAAPLIRTMYIRDPSRSHFQIQKCLNEQEHFEACQDIKYDGWLQPKPWYVDELNQKYLQWLDELDHQ
jgi:hypothetical protein